MRRTGTYKGVGKAAEILKDLSKAGKVVENVGDAGQAIGPINNVPTPATKKLVVDKNPVGHPTPAAVPHAELKQLRDTNIYRDSEGKLFVKQADGTLVPATPEDVANAGKQMQAASKAEDGYVEAQGMAGGGAKAIPSNLHPDARRALSEIDNGLPRHNVRSSKQFVNDGRGGTPRLPGTDANGLQITYTEHTVNPRPPHGTLDGKRIIVGSDGSVWYTNDHFTTWEKVR